MASSENRHVQEHAREADAARQAAQVAVELSERGQPRDPRRLIRALNGVARSAGRVAGRGAGVGAGMARRGVSTAWRRASTAGRGATSLLNWLTAQVIAMGPRLRVRDQATLRAEIPGRSDDEIGELLVDRAARAAAAVGGATGAWAALPGMPAAASAADRARAYLASWAHRRGVYLVPSGLLLVAGSPLARQLRRRLAARIRRSTFALGPLFTGAIAGAVVNRRETKKLGRDIIEDLRRRPGVPAEPVSRPPLTGP